MQNTLHANAEVVRRGYHGFNTADMSLLTEIFQRGGDAIVDRFRQGVDEAKEDLAELRGNLRDLVGRSAPHPREWAAFGPAEIERMFQRGFERMAHALDIPRRSELREISERPWR